MKKETFEVIKKWQNETFPDGNALAQAHHLKEEVEELIEAIESENIEHTFKELADCQILVAGISANLGLNHEAHDENVNQKMAINILRVWGKPDKNGVINHVKDADKYVLNSTHGVDLIEAKTAKPNEDFIRWERDLAPIESNF